MSKLCILALMMGSLSGCQSQSENPEAVFLTSFQQAYDRKDVDATLKLVYWDGVEGDIQENIENSIKEVFAMEIERLAIVEPPENQDTQYTQLGKTFKTNLDVKKVFEIHYKSQPGTSQIQSTKFLIGENGGRYFITTAVPLK